MEPPPTVRAVKMISPLHGITQPRLLEADDGNQYVVKSKSNVRGTRILVNEAVMSGLLELLGIAAMPWRYVSVSASFIAENPEMRVWKTPGEYVALAGEPLTLENLTNPRGPGLCFGSLYSRADQSYTNDDPVQNVEDFLGALVADAWVCNEDWRQAVLKRSPQGLLARMVDHSEAFNAHKWTLEHPLISPRACQVCTGVRASTAA